MNNDDARFDSAMRSLHLEAVDHISPQVRQRLRGARTASSRAPRALGWGLASGCAALFGLVIGLQLHAPPAGTSAPDESAVVTAAPAATVAEPEGLAAVEQNPDFYLWLASTDAALPVASLE